MWIKKLELKNFQAHKHTVIDFNDQFNCIVGPSRAGKSSVVRALNFLFFDKWSDSYVRNGSAFTELILHLDNGYIISRSKSVGSVVNKIVVTNPDKTQQQPYEKFGTDTPEPVRKILQIYPVKIDVDADVEVNVADQDHSPFLLSESGPVKTKYINRLTGAHVLDAAMRSVNKDKSSLLTEKSLILDNVEQLTGKLSKFSNVYTVKDKLSKYYADCKRIHKQVALLRKVELARQDIEKFTVRVTAIDNMLSVIDTVIVKLEGTVAVTEQLKLWQHLKEACRIEKEIDAALIKVQADEKALLVGVKQCPLCGTMLNL